MSYLVLARKYRPQTFDEVIGQKHVTKTLINAIKADRVAHAILFSGPRGTGKTTIARILAKSINCAEGPAPLPCNKCRSCREITSGNAVDVFEIDGASNNSVDQIRELRENIRYMPAHSRFKIYIIDEVHMLSIAAFNALLKTLEEPPPHVKFMFATTEPHKIPITILSRCQRHDLRRIDLTQITEHMAYLCNQEGFPLDEESLDIIGREADGSMRDALSLLDQIISSMAGQPPGHEDILKILGVADRRLIFQLSQAVLEKDIGSTLGIIDDIYNRGYNLKKFYSDVVEHFRNLMIVKITGNPGRLLDVPAHESEAMAGQTANVSQTLLSQVMDLLMKEENAIKHSSLPKIAFEMVFIKLFHINPALSFDELIKSLDNIKKGNPEALHTVPQKAASETVLSRPENAAEPAIPAYTNPVPEPEAADPASTQTPTAKTPQEMAEPPSLRETADDKKRQTEQNRAEVKESAAQYNTHGSKEDSWKQIKQLIASSHPPLAACIAKSSLKNLTNTRIEIEISANSFSANMIKREKNQKAIHDICRDFFGRELQVVIQTVVEDDSSIKQKKDQTTRLRQEAMSHALVSKAIEVFNGKVVDVNIIQEEK